MVGSLRKTGGYGNHDLIGSFILHLPTERCDMVPAKMQSSSVHSS
jgi:hypothetical protein